MFRVKEVGDHRRFTFTARVIELSLLIALLASFTSAVLWLREYRILDRAAAAEALTSQDEFTLRTGVFLQLAFVCVEVIGLAVGLAAALWLRRRYSLSEESLRQVKMLAHNILASMDRGVLTTDLSGTITSVNSAAMRLLLLNSECVGQYLAQVSPPDIPLLDTSRLVSARKTIRDKEVVLVREERRLRLRLDGNLLSDTHDTPLGCVIHIEDTTGRMLMEERMLRMERFLGLSTLASSLHHEIKNPLTALSIHVQLLEESLGKLEGVDSLEEVVSVLKDEVGRLNGVLENFRSFAHLQRLTLRPTDVIGVVENAIRLIRPQASEQQVRITFLHSDMQPPLLSLDPDKFEQAVLNLVINALEAMPSGGTLTLSAAIEENELRVSVADSGPGIPPDVQPNLFQPYFSTKEKGTGMGLALSEKLIGQHGGRIEFKTGPEGTTFRINVPLTPPCESLHE